MGRLVKGGPPSFGYKQMDVCCYPVRSGQGGGLVTESRSRVCLCIQYCYLLFFFRRVRVADSGRVGNFLIWMCVECIVHVPVTWMLLFVVGTRGRGPVWSRTRGAGSVLSWPGGGVRKLFGPQGLVEPGLVGETGLEKEMRGIYDE